jgi:hypothetical protein
MMPSQVAAMRALLPGALRSDVQSVIVCVTCLLQGADAAIHVDWHTACTLCSSCIVLKEALTHANFGNDTTERSVPTTSI